MRITMLAAALIFSLPLHAQSEPQADAPDDTPSNPEPLPYEDPADPQPLLPPDPPAAAQDPAAPAPTPPADDETKPVAPARPWWVKASQRILLVASIAP